MADTGKLAQLGAQPPEVTALVERCRQGEREALAQFYRQYRGDVARNLFRVLGPHRDDVEDVVQEVFIEVFRSIARFRGDSKVSTWLYRVCVNVALQRLRKRRRLNEVSPPDDDHHLEISHEQTPQRALETRERMRAVYRILDELSPKKRVVFVLHEIEGREPKEIAGIVGAPVLTVRTRLHYARKEFYERASREPAFDEAMARDGDRTADAPGGPVMGCVNARKLADLTSGRLSEREATRVRVHLEGCPICRAQSTRVRRITDTLQAIAEAPPPPLSAPSAARVEATLRWTRVEPEPAVHVRTGPSRYRLVLVASAAAAAAIVAGAVGGRWWFGHGRSGPIGAPAGEAVIAQQVDKAPAVATSQPVAPAPSAPIRPIITLVGGEVHVVHPDGTRAPVGPAQALAPGDSLVTGASSRVAFQWGEGSGALVEGEGELLLARLEPRAQELMLRRGEVAVRVGPHQAGEWLRVSSPDHTVTVHGTWFVVAAEPRGTQVQVLEGIVEIAALKQNAASTRLVAPSRAFFARGRGAAENERALTGHEAAQLRVVSEMGLLPFTGSDLVLDATGVLDISSSPPGELVVDGVDFGRTPLLLRRPRERHLVELTRPGFAPLRRWITVGDKVEKEVLELRSDPDKVTQVDPGPDEAQLVVASRRRRIQACYERVLKHDASLTGSITLELRVGSAGQVASSKVTADTLGNPKVITCVRREAKGWLFPHARNVTVEYPFVFRAP